MQDKKRKILGICNKKTKDGALCSYVHTQLCQFDDYSIENGECGGVPVETLYIRGKHFDISVYLNNYVEPVWDSGFGGKAICTDLNIKK